VAWLSTERLKLSTIAQAAKQRAASLPMSDAISSGLGWVYNRAVSGAPGLDGAAGLAGEYRDRHSSIDAAINALIARQTRQASAAGFITGLGGAVTLPLLLPAHFVSTLYIQIQLVAAIAHLRGYDIGSDEVRFAAFACLSGSAAARLKTAGVNLGAQFAKQMATRIPVDIVKNIGGVAGAHLVQRIGAHTGISAAKALPVLGGVMSAGFDAATTRLIGRTAQRLFVLRAVPPETAQ
jgi:hypothetical protein